MNDFPPSEEPLGEAVMASLSRLSLLIAGTAIMTHEWDVYNAARDIANEAYALQQACTRAHHDRMNALSKGVLNSLGGPKKAPISIDIEDLDI